MHLKTGSGLDMYRKQMIADVLTSIKATLCFVHSPILAKWPVRETTEMDREKAHYTKRFSYD